MIRPYLAVISDAFREAIASRVLWIVLILITFFLISLSPLGVYRTRSARLQWSDLLDPVALGERLAEQIGDPQPSPGKKLFELLDVELQRQLATEGNREAGSDHPRREAESIFALVGQLNRILDDPKMYDPEAWHDVVLDDEAKELVERPASMLSEDDVRRRNRLLLEAAYPGLIAVSPPTSVQFHYATMDVFPPLPIREESFASLMRQVLASIMDFFVGTLAVFVAILVTAPIIPHMLETGSIELLLSKPISRMLLFLAKFVGGCAFILLNATYLIGGFWLIAGWRFGVWEPRLLLCIPVFLFLFMVYYSVSALAGLIWRSAIVCVVVTILFWATCFSVGSAKTLIENLALTPERIVKVVPAGDTVLSVNEANLVQRWSSKSRTWEPVFTRASSGMMLGGPGPRMIGPVYDARANQAVAVQLPWNTGPGTRAGANLEVGRADDEWTRKPAAEVPGGTVALFSDSAGDVIAVAREGIFRLPAGEINVSERKKDDNLFMELPAFEPMLSARQLSLWSPQEACMDPGSEAIAVIGRDHVSVLHRTSDGNYALQASDPRSTDEESALIALAGPAILLAAADGKITVLNAESLQVQSQYRPEEQNQPRFVRGSPDGSSITVLFHNGNLWLYDTREKQMSRAAVAGQGDISAADFESDGRLLVADRTTRVSAYKPGTFELEQQLEPKMELLEMLYRHAVLPLYTVFPRPGELGNTVRYLLTEKETGVTLRGEQDLMAPRVKFDPWSPVYSSLAFTLGVLIVCCWYIHRTEF